MPHSAAFVIAAAVPKAALHNHICPRTEKPKKQKAGSCAGTATITVSASADASVKATCTVTVADAKVRLSESQVTLGAGESRSISIICSGSDAVTISGTNDAAATMDASGKITAKAVGKTTITVSCGGESAVCEVEVLGKPGSVTIAAASKKLAVGKSFALNATLPEGTASALTYTSSDEKVARVDGSGRDYRCV